MLLKQVLSAKQQALQQLKRLARKAQVVLAAAKAQPVPAVLAAKKVAALKRHLQMVKNLSV